jgi:hypothetical protein
MRRRVGVRQLNAEQLLPHRRVQPTRELQLLSALEEVLVEAGLCRLAAVGRTPTNIL